MNPFDIVIYFPYHSYVCFRIFFYYNHISYVNRGQAKHSCSRQFMESQGSSEQLVWVSAVNIPFTVSLMQAYAAVTLGSVLYRQCH